MFVGNLWRSLSVLIAHGWSTHVPHGSRAWLAPIPPLMCWKDSRKANALEVAFGPWEAPVTSPSPEKSRRPRTSQDTQGDVPVSLRALAAKQKYLPLIGQDWWWPQCRGIGAPTREVQVQENGSPKEQRPLQSYDRRRSFGRPPPLWLFCHFVTISSLVTILPPCDFFKHNWLSGFVTYPRIYRLFVCDIRLRLVEKTVSQICRSTKLRTRYVIFMLILLKLKAVGLCRRFCENW